MQSLNIIHQEGGGPFEAMDLPAETRHLDLYLAQARLLDKNCQSYALGRVRTVDSIEMACITLGTDRSGLAAEPALLAIINTNSPMQLDIPMTEAIVELAGAGQALHFVRELRPLGDLPTDELVKQLMQDDHLITAPHTLEHWPQELYLTDPVIDRTNREAWEEGGSPQLYERACEQVEQRLANYVPVETDAAIDSAMCELVRDGLVEQQQLPQLPPLAEPPAPSAKTGRRGRARKRRRRS